MEEKVKLYPGILITPLVSEYESYNYWVYCDLSQDLTSYSRICDESTQTTQSSFHLLIVKVNREYQVEVSTQDRLDQLINHLNQAETIAIQEDCPELIKILRENGKNVNIHDQLPYPQIVHSNHQSIDPPSIEELTLLGCQEFTTGNPHHPIYIVLNLGHQFGLIVPEYDKHLLYRRVDSIDQLYSLILDLHL